MCIYFIMKLLLFDVDGTLTKPRLVITQDMLNTLIKLKNNKNIHIGFVGGSDLNKQIEQIGQENFYLFNWKFSENGLNAFKNNEEIYQGSFSSFLGEIHFKKLVKNYNPDDDRSRKGGPKELTRGREPIVEKAKPNSPGLDKSEGGRVLPTAETLIDGEASSSSGEDDVVSEFLEGLEEERE